MESAGRLPTASIAHADVAIVGAGPAGLATAVRLGQLGVGRVVMVDRADFPRDKTCGSAVSPKGCEILKQLDVIEAVSNQSYAIGGLRLVTPRGHDLTIASPHEVALICNRRVLDHLLLQKAQQSGVIFLGGFEATHLLQRGDRVVGIRGADGREVRASYTVVADGAHSRLASDRGPRNLIQAIMGWWDNVPFRSHHIEMIFDGEIAPLYGWLFPEGPNRVNIGICYERGELEENARHLFQRFIVKHYRDRLQGASQVGTWKGHPISYAMRVERLTSPGRIVVGEAGRMTHPATAEGIYQAMQSGIFAAQALHDILTKRVEAARALRDYERACRKAFGVSFRGASVWRRLVSSGGLDVLASAMNRPMSQRLLARCMARM